jgi:hypothetical protein
VIDAHTLSILHEIIRRESLSFVHYLRDSFPWPSPDGSDAERALAPILEQEHKALGDLYRFLTRMKAPFPYVGSYPSVFTTRNFISLHGLIPLLLEDERGLIGALERDRRAIGDEQPHGVVSHLLDVKQANVNRLEQLSQSNPVAAVH